MRWPWQKKKFKPGGFDKGGHERGRSYIVRIFTEVTGEPHKLTSTRDLRYIALKESKLQEFVWRYYQPSLDYQPNFPDCDDFTVMARGSIIYGASKEKFKSKIDNVGLAPIFGGISYYSKRLKAWHRACWAITAEGKLVIFEPQSSDRWYTWEEEVVEWRNAEI